MNRPVEHNPGTAESRRIAHSQNSTKRGRKSKAQLIDAARDVFEREGYFNATVHDIVAGAGLARGSFYTYFTSKSEVLELIAKETLGRLAEASMAPAETLLVDPVGVVERFNMRYLRVYEENARMLEVITQVAVVDPIHQQARLQSRREMVETICNAIRTWQHHGFADPDIDPTLTAAALASMMTNFTYWWMIGNDPQDIDAASDTLIKVWIKTLGLDSNLVERSARRSPDAILGPINTPAESATKPTTRRGYWK